MVLNEIEEHVGLEHHLKRAVTLVISLTHRPIDLETVRRDGA